MARPVIVERDEGMTRITVPMQRLYAPVPKWVLQMDLLSLVIAPLWWIGALLVRSCLQLPTPQRAIFEITSEQLTMTLCDPGTGEINIFKWARAAIVEIRANRYERGLWVDVPGKVKQTFLHDLTRETIERLEVELRAAIVRNALTEPREQ